MSKGTRVSSLLHRILYAVCLVIPMLLAAHPARAQVVLMPGQELTNIAAAGRVLENTGDTLVAHAAVSFDRADEQTQEIRLVATSGGVLTASARGILFVDFCVPREGVAGCDAVSDPAAPDVTASLTFGYGLVGYVSAAGLARATFQASASVIDLETSTYASFQSLADLSASHGTVKVIKDVPVLIPDFTGAKVTLPVTFTTLLKRGRRYRFQLAGAARARSVLNGGTAISDFLDALPQFPAQSGRIQLHNLSIRISSAQPSQADLLQQLQDVVSSLQGQMGNLVDQIATLDANLADDVSGLRQDMADLAQRTDVPGSLLMLPAGSPAPTGWKLLGRFTVAPSGGRYSHQREKRHFPKLLVDVYQRNPS